MPVCLQDFTGEKNEEIPGLGGGGGGDLSGALETMSPLTAYCIRVIKENKPPTLLAEIEQLKVKCRCLLTLACIDIHRRTYVRVWDLMCGCLYDEGRVKEREEKEIGGVFVTCVC